MIPRRAAIRIPCTKTVPGSAFGTTVDGAGNLVLSEFAAVEMVPQGCYVQNCQIPMNGPLNYPYPFEVTGADGAFIDGSGNLYIADAYDYSGVEEAYAATAKRSRAVGGSSGSFGSPRSIAVDASGRCCGQRLGGAEEIPAGCTAISCVKILIPATANSNFMFGMGMDGVGNAYFETSGSRRRNDYLTNPE